jgi:hypothetical protein
MLFFLIHPDTNYSALSYSHLIKEFYTVTALLLSVLIEYVSVVVS